MLLNHRPSHVSLERCQSPEAAWFDGEVEAASPEPVEELGLPVQSSSHRGGSHGGDINGVDTANPAHYPNGVTPLIPRGELTKSRFLVTNGRCSARGPDLGWRSVKIVKALTGALISQCQIVEEMTGAELLNCVTTLASRALNVPRLCLLFTWTCSSVPQEVVACATLHPLTGSLDKTDEMYDPRFDETELDHREWSGKNMFPCLACGDPTVDIDTVSTPSGWDSDRHRKSYCPWAVLKNRKHLDRDDLCARCHPCAICENCRFEVGGVSVCMDCLEEVEVSHLSTSGQYRYSMIFSKGRLSSNSKEESHIRGGSTIAVGDVA